MLIDFNNIFHRGKKGKRAPAACPHEKVSPNGSPKRKGPTVQGAGAHAPISTPTEACEVLTPRKGGSRSGNGGGGNKGAKPAAKGGIRGGTVGEVQNEKASAAWPGQLENCGAGGMGIGTDGGKWKVGVSVGGTAAIPLNLGGIAGRCKSWFARNSSPRSAKKKSDPLSPKKRERTRPTHLLQNTLTGEGSRPSKVHESNPDWETNSLPADACAVPVSQESAARPLQRGSGSKRRSKLKVQTHDLPVLDNFKERNDSAQGCLQSSVRSAWTVLPSPKNASSVATGRHDDDDNNADVYVDVDVDDTELWERIAELVGPWAMQCQLSDGHSASVSVHNISDRKICNAVRKVQGSPVDSGLSGRVDRVEGNQSGPISLIPPLFARSSGKAFDAAMRPGATGPDSRDSRTVGTDGRQNWRNVARTANGRRDAAALADDTTSGLFDVERAGVDNDANAEEPERGDLYTQSTCEASSSETIGSSPASLRVYLDEADSEPRFLGLHPSAKLGQSANKGARSVKERGSGEWTGGGGNVSQTGKPRESLSSILNKALSFRERGGDASPIVHVDIYPSPQNLLLEGILSSRYEVARMMNDGAYDDDIDEVAEYDSEECDDEGDGEVDDGGIGLDMVTHSSSMERTCNDYIAEDVKGKEEGKILEPWGESCMSAWEEMAVVDHGEVMDECVVSTGKAKGARDVRATYESEESSTAVEDVDGYGDIVDMQSQSAWKSSAMDVLERCSSDDDALKDSSGAGTFGSLDFTPVHHHFRVNRGSDGAEELAKAVLAMAAEDGWSISDGVGRYGSGHDAVFDDEIAEMDEQDVLCNPAMRTRVINEQRGCGKDGDGDMDAIMSTAEFQRSGRETEEEEEEEEGMDVEVVEESEQVEWNGSDSSFELPEVVVKVRERASREWVMVTGMPLEDPEVGSRKRRDLSLYAESTGESLSMRPLSPELIIDVLKDGCTRLVLYTTSMRAVRKTFDACQEVRQILRCHSVEIDERDVSIDAGYREELRTLMGTRSIELPQVFIRGLYIGGLEEMNQLNESEELTVLFEGLPRRAPQDVCEACADLRFLVCTICNGSRKTLLLDMSMERCINCNEYGLERCPICN